MRSYVLRRRTYVTYQKLVSAPFSLLPRRPYVLRRRTYGTCYKIVSHCHRLLVSGRPGHPKTSGCFLSYYARKKTVWFCGDSAASQTPNTHQTISCRMSRFPKKEVEATMHDICTVSNPSQTFFCLVLIQLKQSNDPLQGYRPFVGSGARPVLLSPTGPFWAVTVPVICFGPANRASPRFS